MAVVVKVLSVWAFIIYGVVRMDKLSTLGSEAMCMTGTCLCLSVLIDTYAFGVMQNEIRAVLCATDMGKAAQTARASDEVT